MDPTSDEILGRRRFLALVGTAVGTVAVLAYLILFNHREKGTPEGGSSGEDGSRGSNQSSDTGGDRPLKPSVEIQVSRDVATVVIEQSGWAEVFVVEWFDVSPSEAETAVGEGYTGERVSEIPAGESESRRFTELSAGTYVVVAETRSRRQPVGSFEIGSL